MELFTVNRYTEESNKSLGDGKSTNEDEILQKLLQKAEKRKRKHKASESIKETSKDAAKTATEVEPEEQQQQQAVAETPVEQQLPEESNDFQVLGADAASAKRAKVEMVLPAWLAHPTIIEGGSLKPELAEGEVDAAAIKAQPFLEKHIRSALKQLKIKRLFPVQRAVIPWILEAQNKPEPFRPRDICVSAPTGSGKTLAFAIPIVQLLAQRVECKVRALVVLPVAELALQVYKVFSALCSQTELEVCLLSKQQRLEDEQQKLLELYKGVYYSKVDIVVTTPGRLVDHLHATKGFSLKSLQFLVIDEADRIMDAVFQNWLYHLDEHVRSTADQLLAGVQAPLCYQQLLQSYGQQPHKLLFSATLSQDPEKLQNLKLFQPKLFTTLDAAQTAATAAETALDEQEQPSGQFIGKYTTPAELVEQHCLTEVRLKPLTLFALVQQNGWKRFLCFTNSTDTADRLCFVLKQLFEDSPIKVEQLSAKCSAAQRAQRLNEFARGSIQGLICSDALARGIDVANVDIVISYEAARHIKTYIHRVGRTARAGQAGTAITLLTEKDQAQFKQMLNAAGKRMGEELSVSPDIEVQHAVLYKRALEALRQRQENQKNVQKVQKMRNSRKAAAHKPAPAAAAPAGQLTLMEQLQHNAASQLWSKQHSKAAKPTKAAQPKQQTQVKTTRKNMEK